MINIWIIILPTVLFSLTVRFNQEEREKTWIAFGVFSVFYAIRGPVGTDWQEYLYYFNNISDPILVAKSGFEKGYVLLCKLFSTLGLSYWVMVFFVSLFVAFLFYKGTEQQTKNAGIAVLLGLFYFFYPSLEALRQTIALALFLYSLKYMNSKPLYYVLLNLCGMLFHRTAIIAFFFILFSKFLWVKIGSACIIIFFPLLKPVLFWGAEFFPVLYEKIVWYIGDSGSFSHLLSLKVIECVGLLIIYYLFKARNERERLTINLLELGVWIQALLPIIMDGAYRFGYYSDIGIILAYCGIYDRIKEQKHRRIYVVVLIAYVILRFLRLIMANSQVFVWQ